MNTTTHIWPHLAHFFLEWEMLRTKVAEELKTHILGSVTFFFENRAVYEMVEKYCRGERATDENMGQAHTLTLLFE